MFSRPAAQGLETETPTAIRKTGQAAGDRGIGRSRGDLGYLAELANSRSQVRSLVQLQASINAGPPEWRPFAGAEPGVTQLASGKKSKHNRKNARLAKSMGFHSSELPSPVRVEDIERADRERSEPQSRFPIFRRGDQRIILVGTQHGVSGQDLSSEIPEEMLTNAALILEYPPLRSGQSSFSKEEIATVSDKTQAELAKFGAENQDRGVKLVGADARKAFEDDSIHSISIRHKVDVAVPNALLENGDLLDLAETYLSKSLRLSRGGIGEVAEQVGTLVDYTDDTDLGFVLQSSYARVRKLANRLSRGRRRAVQRAVLKKLRQDLAEDTAYYDDNIETYRQHDFEADLIEETNTSKISHLYDAFANLLLYTEVLASDEDNVVVAYGAEHLDPLAELLD